MKGEGLLKAATETLSATVERIEKEREADRRTMTALMHEMEGVTERLGDIIPAVAEIKRELSKRKTGRLLKVRKMAAAVDMNPRTLQNMARAGHVRAHRHGDLDDWLFDPDEVVADLKRSPTDLYGYDAERDRQIMERIEQAGAIDVENGV